MLVVALGVLMAGWSSNGGAAEHSKTKEGAADASVELFAAMEAGEIDVKFVPKDSKEATVLVENKGDKPLRVKLPAAFAGVPALAQRGDFGDMGGGDFGDGGDFGGGGRDGFGGGGGGMQGMGGGFGGMGGMGGMGGFGGMGGMGGMNMGGMGGMGGFFNVRPGKVRKVEVKTVCLEHGKEEPNPRVEYKMVPIEQFTQKPEVIEICKMVGAMKGSKQELEQLQQAAQAAAWRYTDGLSWNQLADKVGVKPIHGPAQPYFTMAQLQLGRRIATQAVQRVENNPQYQDRAYQDKANSLSTP
ncbi:MAG: hypothetical protein ACODAD_02325 [Planctomycetota bacterium]